MQNLLELELLNCRAEVVDHQLALVDSGGGGVGDGVREANAMTPQLVTTV